MKTLLLTTPVAKTKPRTMRSLVPEHLPGWRVKTLASDVIDRLTTAPDVTMVEIAGATQPAAVTEMIPRLVSIQAKAPERSHVVFSFQNDVNPKLVNVVNDCLPEFPNPQFVDVLLAETSSNIQIALNLLRAKLDLAVHPRPSPLDQIQQVVEAARDLRVPTGNLSAERVAKLYGVSLSQLAKWLGRSRQALTKTPGADSLQRSLSFFERIARLRLALKSDSDFRTWLRTAQPALDSDSPLELMSKGEWQVVVDLVEDMLTGAPS